MGKSLVETLLHDFWMLSLCLEDAIEGDRWDEVTALLQRREETLRTLERLEPDPNWLPLLRRALGSGRALSEPAAPQAARPAN
jgi:hypothetical protein